MAEEQLQKDLTLFSDGTKVKVSRPFNPRTEISNADAQYIAKRIVKRCDVDH